MRYFLGKQDMPDLKQAQKASFLLTNGLGGYTSVTAAYCVPRCDQGILVAAVKAPNERITLVHRMRETLRIGKKDIFLSSQCFPGRKPEEDGYRHLTGFVYEHIPVWTYQVNGVRVTRSLCMAREENTVAVLYEIQNNTPEQCRLLIEPFLKFAPKENALETGKQITFENGSAFDGTNRMFVRSNGKVAATARLEQNLAYPEDAKDGRLDKGCAVRCFRITKDVAPGKTEKFEVVFSTQERVPAGEEVREQCLAWYKQLEDGCSWEDPIARQLVMAADAYIARRDSTNGKTILAGYPLFSDWGRDTMIALPGCCLATGRFEDAKSILRTFLTYEKDGLVPNLFPEGASQPMYNTVDAALLLIDSVWQYVQRTGDWDFVREAWPVMERIIANYRKGTHHSIGMDSDGLICAGGGLDQVTWMDVCVNGILPTPRHGKPVEINAYWYNALRIMDAVAEKLGFDRADYLQLSEQVQASFVEKFYMEDKGYLKDMLSGTKADEQLRCNQIWAISMPFTMLNHQQEKKVVQTVERYLHTPCGLRTLSPEDEEYRGHYGGEQLVRDLAYHQGTTWVFPMGAYYLAYLKVHGYCGEAASYVRSQLDALEPMLREGCLGQLPEIYDGDHPSEGKGCFGQAWSVGEMIRVFETLEKIKEK